MPKFIIEDLTFLQQKYIFLYLVSTVKIKLSRQLQLILINFFNCIIQKSIEYIVIVEVLTLIFKTNRRQKYSHINVVIETKITFIGIKFNLKDLKWKSQTFRGLYSKYSYNI